MTIFAGILFIAVSFGEKAHLKMDEFYKYVTRIKWPAADHMEIEFLKAILLFICFQCYGFRKVRNIFIFCDVFFC